MKVSELSDLIEIQETVIFIDGRVAAQKKGDVWLPAQVFEKHSYKDPEQAIALMLSFLNYKGIIENPTPIDDRFIRFISSQQICLIFTGQRGSFYRNCTKTTYPLATLRKCTNGYLFTKDGHSVAVADLMDLSGEIRSMANGID